MSHGRGISVFLSLTVLAALACNLGVTPATQGKSHAVAAVALRLDDGQTRLEAFVGAGSQTWPLLPGTYLVHATDGSGITIVFPEMQIVEAPLIWPTDFRSVPGKADPGQAGAIKALVGFLISAQAAKLAALEFSSAGFTLPLFSAEPGQAELDGLEARYDALAAQRSLVMTALEAILQASRSDTMPPKLAAPLGNWKDNLAGFFGYAAGSGSRARQRILAIAEDLSPEDQADAFDVLRTGFKTDSANFDELALKLQAGQLDTQAAQIESDMRNAPGFAAAAQQAGATVAQVVHQEGGELVAEGAQLQAAVIKAALGDAFPDITQGFELADKAQEWTEYVGRVYKNPLAVAEGEARTAIQEKIKDQILEKLHECCAALADDVAHEIADSVSEQAMGAVPSLVETIQATQTALAAASIATGPVLSDRDHLDLVDTFTEKLTYPHARQIDFQTNMVLTAAKQSGILTGSLEGDGTYELDVQCNDVLSASTIYETGTASYNLRYSAMVRGNFDAASGTFSASLSPSGAVTFQRMTRPFTNSNCVGMNSDLNVTLPFTGDGGLDGVITADDRAQLTTHWTLLEAGSVDGAWSGQAQVTP